MSRKGPSRHWRDRAMDAIEASEETRGFVEGMNFESFAADARTVKAAMANFAIIGDKAYDSDQLDEDLDDEGIELIAPHRKNRKPENVT